MRESGGGDIIQPRMSTTPIIVADSTALIAIERNILELLIRIPWRETTIWIAMKIASIPIEMPSTLGAVTELHIWGISAIGLMKIRMLKIRLKAFVSNIGLSRRFKASIISHPQRFLPVFNYSIYKYICQVYEQPNF